MIRTAALDWRDELRTLLGSAKHEVIVCTPFVSVSGTAFVEKHLPDGYARHGRVDFLTNLSVGNLCQRATDPRALKQLTQQFPNTAVHHIPGLHAKTYVADNSLAIVTSGNLTAGGLYRNLENAVVVDDPSVVQEIKSQLLDFASLGAKVPHDILSTYCDTVSIAFESIKKDQRIAQESLRLRIASALQPLEDELIRLRLSSGAMHTVFARTIEFLLRTRGPLLTVEMHPMIAAIHPDLCDNSVDRVIDGRHFGKKWKHAVRTAQQQLKEKGVVVYIDKKWSIKKLAQH
jgi:hypothetical protein